METQEAAASAKMTQPEYSPYLDQNYTQQVYFGDTHLHTAYSTDAGMIGNRLGPDKAYRFARGEAVVSSTGTSARLSRPLDFLVVADHAENLGLAPMIAEENPALLKTEFGKKVYDLVKKGDPWAAFAVWGAEAGANRDPLAGQEEMVRSMWERVTSAADRYNAPGKFTAFIGYEWTSTPGGNNLHRNIIFRDGKTKADKILPFSSYDSQNPEALWAWMAAYEQNTGGRLLAIPHNGNLSNGLMFDSVTLNDKKPIDKDYAERRRQWEPLYEVTQMKGDGEAHPLLSPNDEFADFEKWDKGSFGPEAKTPDMLPREYAREALKSGLAYEAKLGANPFKFGMIGSTDSHTSLATTQEDNFFGMVTPLEPGRHPVRFDMKITGYLNGPVIKAWQSSASGLAAVWATDNTREALFDAMARKEVYATTGKRMILRIFAGWEFVEDDLYREDFVRNGYKNGVPMGGDLSNAPQDGAPVFMVSALRDSQGANLDRIQIVKGWLGADGNTHERIYDIAVSDGRNIGANGRCKTPVGNSVDVQNASYRNTIGDPQLMAYWKDPEFNPEQRAFYYVRVLEIPTPRWT
ncbi:MAG: DUF3604 domain-containing protein, partial [Deltaproteobacteria bacterium]|nr:DUF3604 domain-containing protein [Deltaproteobacteria bacterium]